MPARTAITAAVFFQLLAGGLLLPACGGTRELDHPAPPPEPPPELQKALHRVDAGSVPETPAADLGAVDAAVDAPLDADPATGEVPSGDAPPAEAPAGDAAPAEVPPQADPAPAADPN